MLGTRNSITRISVLSAALFFCCLSFSSAADLVVDATTQTLSGEYVFDSVSIINGGQLIVAPYDGAAGGSLKLKAKTVVIDAFSSISADSKGYRGVFNGNGEGPGSGIAGVGDGGGGGAYGGQGGYGVFDGGWGIDGLGGLPYGAADTMDIEMGSAGGASGWADYIPNGGSGGNGGGAIWIEANSINNAGAISANGDEGEIAYNDSTGGGAGGGILLVAGTMVNSGSLKANGGGGGTTKCITPGVCGQDDGGGGGSGGRIKLFYGSLSNSGNASVTGGVGGIYAQAGANGTFFQKMTFISVSIDIKPGSYPNSINLGSNGTVPVAIFSTADFDATTIDPSTVNLAGASVAIKANGVLQSSLQDVNGDGLMDIVVHINTEALQLTDGDVTAYLTGKTSSGVPIKGSDSVRVVPAK